MSEHVREWVDAGLISDEQAAAIEQFELDRVAPQGTERLGIAAEVAAYLGSVLALMGGIVVVGQRWREMAVPGRLAIALAVALVGSIAGTWLVRLAEPGTTRLGTFLWVVGTAGVGLAVGVVFDEADARAEVTGIGVGVAVLAMSVGLWRNLDRPLQLVTAVIGAGIAAVALRELTGIAAWWAGIVVWLVAVAFGAATAMDRIRPRLVGLAAASVVAMLGAAMLSDLDEHVGPAVAALTAAGVVAYALVDRSMPLLVVGIIGFLIATQALIATTFTGLAGSTVVTVLGLVVVVVIVVRARGRTPTGTG
jgi:hypothetical protein